MRRFFLALAFVGAVATVTARAQDPAGDDGRSKLDVKRVGARYRIKVSSAGVPTLGGFLEGYRCRTTYRVFDREGKLQGSGFLNEYVYVDGPGEYQVEVHGQRVTETFAVPEELTPDRVQAAWRRARAVELRPKSGARLTVPSIWVLHPPQVTGEHNDDYTVLTLPRDPKAPRAQAAKGVAVVYPPEEIHDIDDGVLFDNTLVHLWPGVYELVINGTHQVFELKAGDTKLVRLAALVVHEAKGGLWQRIAQESPPVKAEHALEKPPVVGRFFVCCPGSYESSGETVELAAGGAGALHGVKRPFGDKPRLGIKATDAGRDEGVLVSGLVEGGAAGAAGVKVGDRITALDGKNVKGQEELLRALEAKKPGDEVELSIHRHGRAEPVTVKVKLGG